MDIIYYLTTVLPRCKNTGHNVFPFRALGGLPYKGMITEAAWNLEQGIYRHGASIFPEGNYGILIVIRAESYICQIDIVLSKGIYFRTAHSSGSVEDIYWTKL